MLWAYFGPETMMPLTSVMAALVGCALMFGRGIGVAFRAGMARLSGRPRRAPLPRNVRRDTGGPAVPHEAVRHEDEVVAS